MADDEEDDAAAVAAAPVGNGGGMSGITMPVPGSTVCVGGTN